MLYSIPKYAMMMAFSFVFVSSALSDGKKTTSSHRLCEQDGFYCLKVKRGESWEKLFPDEYERGIVMRINRRNGSLYSGMTIAVPEHLHGKDLLDFSPFPRQVEPPHENVLIFDPKQHAFAAYDSSGSLIKWGPAVGGANYCPDIDSACHTKAGEFRIYSLGSSNCVSSKYPIDRGGAPMPYCMYFNGGQAFHGSPGGVAGKNASHGCVRLFVQDAEWMRYEFAEGPAEGNDFKGTKVVVLPYH